ncbi:hypothetical protein [Methylomonas methanica]|uniref:Uncharacterized protein n=1 Tax=Methylomonas methanica (strain DSM 25384 / MC09) TaxID=857087 RepID=F9ZV50_METMM|nr:hypothetical protein [Methylomonas methanica]AEF99483.1 hypothetical protein Metme_1047 [Methylomonas methanica MC09]
MDWHCQDTTHTPYSDYYSASYYSPTPINNLADAITYCQSQGYATAQVLQVGDQTLTAVIQQALEIPPQAQLQELWMAGFALPIICYLTAWGYQTVIAWFEEKSN